MAHEDLAERLWIRALKNQTITLKLATPDDLGGFHGELSACHDNVNRWIKTHLTHRAVRGWVVVGTGVLTKHSVVDTGAELLDVTPRTGLDATKLLRFIPH